jgi:hypothetical protein
MRTFSMVVGAATLAQAFAAQPVRAQDAEHVVRAAVAYVQPGLPKGDIAVDDFRTSRALADVAAATLGAKRAHARDVIRCTGPGRGRGCTLEGAAAVVALNEPLVAGRSAQVTVAWWYQATPTRTAMKSVELELARSTDGRWTVTRVISRAVT